MSKDTLIHQYPLLQKLINLEEFLWVNPNLRSTKDILPSLSLDFEDIIDASQRLFRFSSYIKDNFEETRVTNGIIESPLRELRAMPQLMNHYYGTDIKGKVLIKCDNDLSISGSIKARGGIYEVLKHAEDLAVQERLIAAGDNYSKFGTEKFKDFFAQYHIGVGSTGNLGLSIGIVSAKLGFRVTVHMSSDAKEWKKELLRSKGVEVVEYDQDYGKAVKKGRKQSELDPKSYFVDDENSKNLFLGYSVAALRIQKQLEEMEIKIDKEHPLFVYLPCGVGGGPGGVAFGLKHVFKDDVHFFFAEPTHSPCMLLGCMTKTHDKYSVQDFGLDNFTVADGLAVGRASGFVGKSLENLVSGCYSLSDERMLGLLAQLKDSENIDLEPSALAGFGGLLFTKDDVYKNYLINQQISEENITHVVWATGGSMVPQNIRIADYNKGKTMLQK